jgi:IclR family transcriptional regulator, acetate operon repressor
VRKPAHTNAVARTRGTRRRGQSAADRVLDVLFALDTTRARQVCELAASLQIHKSTASRLLATLQTRGLARRSGNDYFLGPILVRLAMRAVGALELLPVARDFVDALASTCAATASLAVLEGSAVRFVYETGGTTPMRAAELLGTALPLHTTASGKVFLAFGASKPGKLDRLGPGTITRHEDLRRDLYLTRQRGYTLSNEEWQAGIGALAAPVFDASATCVAAVAVTVPVLRIRGAERISMARACVDCALRISERLGHS